MNTLKTLLLTAVLACLPLAASANSVDYGNTGGTVTAISGGTALSLIGSMLTVVSGGPCSPLCSGNLGTVTFTTGALTSGSLTTGATFGAGGSLTIMGNGTDGLTGALFTGTFTSATWTVNTLPSGKIVFSFTGTLQGTNGFSGLEAFTIQGSKIVNVNPFIGGHGSVAWASGNTTVSPVPEPGTMALLGTGLIGLAGSLRRKLLG
jgi:hypothetical protein